MSNVSIIYDEIKSRYIQYYGKSGWFYKDYFDNEETGLPYFGESLKNNEGWLDQTKPPTDDDIDTVWDNIKDGLFVSAQITKQIDGLTDKYYGDNSF